MKNLLQLFRKLRKFIGLAFSEKVLLAEALVYAGIARFSILFISFNRLAMLIGKYKEESIEQINTKEEEMVNKVSGAVSAVSRLTPWQSKCLVRALTGQVMLKRRNISSTLYLGVAKDECSNLIAHAWLRSGTSIVTGEKERYMFTEVAKFACHTRGMKQ